jgi:RNA polymerase sigma factor (TIGR02999 family)
MTEITSLLHAAGQGDAQAGERVMALLYADLHRLAHQRMRQAGGGMTLLDTTALVHESYLRLQRSPDGGFDSRHHFMAYAARTMRSVLVDMIRARQAERRGGNAVLLVLDTQLGDQLAAPEDQVLRVHEALEALAQREPRLAQVVEMRFFAGLGEAEIAQALALTERTVERDWAKAKIFLAAYLRH